jgi:C-terminal processing protease CtpA/Prc
VRGADGHVRKVALKRLPDEDRPMRVDRPVQELLAGEVAYVDLDRLERSAVADMFAAIQDKRAVIFDIRGYPRGTGYDIAPRLNVKGAKTGALTHQNLVIADMRGHGASVVYPTPIDATSEPLYRGKVIVLIDEYAQSQAEHLALMFDAAAPVVFVGTESAGANGQLRHVTLPGNVIVSHSGFEVTHADGRQLQRVGVTPHVRVAPTVAGIRAGRDEVLERALEVARQ